MKKFSRSTSYKKEKQASKRARKQMVAIKKFETVFPRVHRTIVVEFLRVIIRSVRDASKKEQQIWCWASRGANWLSFWGQVWVCSVSFISWLSLLQGWLLGLKISQNCVLVESILGFRWWWEGSDFIISGEDVLLKDDFV